MTSESTAAVIDDVKPGEYERLLQAWAVEHDLLPEEILRLESVLDDPEIPDVDAAMSEELQGVLAARRIAGMTVPTAESMKAIRTAFAEGRLATKSLPID